jgi:hypothetical protein
VHDRCWLFALLLVQWCVIPDLIRLVRFQLITRLVRCDGRWVPLGQIEGRVLLMTKCVCRCSACENFLIIITALTW